MQKILCHTWVEAVAEKGKDRRTLDVAVLSSLEPASLTPELGFQSVVCERRHPSLHFLRKGQTRRGPTSFRTRTSVLSAHPTTLLSGGVRKDLYANVLSQIQVMHNAFVRNVEHFDNASDLARLESLESLKVDNIEPRKFFLFPFGHGVLVLASSLQKTVEFQASTWTRSSMSQSCNIKSNQPVRSPSLRFLMYDHGHSSALVSSL